MIGSKSLIHSFNVENIFCVGPVLTRCDQVFVETHQSSACLLTCTVVNRLSDWLVTEKNRTFRRE